MDTETEDERVSLENDGDVAAIIELHFGSRELRDLASNAGVSRERGDTKGETARKLVDQDPALAARILENAHPLDAPADCEPFKERREVGEEHISLREAIQRSRHAGMRDKLESLQRTLAATPHYEAKVEWEYGSDVEDDSGVVDKRAGHHPGLTSIIVEREPDAPDVHWLLEARVHILLTPHGRCRHLDIDTNATTKQYIDKNTPDPSDQWALAMNRIKNFYEPDEEDEG